MGQGALPAADDTLFHLHFSDGISAGLADGHLYPRWMSDANRGFGSAALINYPPLSGYAVAVTDLLTGNQVQAFHLVLLLVMVASGAAFYLCARSFAPPLAAALGSAVYLLAPYRMIDLHARFAFAEVTAFVWLPLLVKFLLDLRQRPSLVAWTGLVICSAGLLLTHVLTAFMLLVAAGPCVAWIVIRDKRWRALGWLILAGVAAFALAAVYLVPLLVERGWTYTEYLTGAWWGDWRTNFLFSDLSKSAVRPTPIRSLVELSFWHSLAAVGLSTVILARSRDRVGMIFLAASLMAIFLQVSVSGWIWRLVPGMEVLQFPWRFQTILVLFSSLLIVSAAARITWGSGLLIGAVGASAMLFAVFLWRGVSYDITADDLERIDISRLIFKEHIPRGVERWEDFEKLPLEGDGLLATTPEADVQVAEWSSHRRQLEVTAKETTQVVLRTFYFPGWMATIDGGDTEVTPVPPLHTLGVSLPPGTHSLDLRFAATPDRRLGAICTALTAGLLLLLNLREKRRLS